MDNSGASDAVSLPSSSDIKGAGLDSKKILPIEKNGKVHKSVDLSRVNSLRSSSVVSSADGVGGVQPNTAMENVGISGDASMSSTFVSLMNNVGLSDVDKNIHNIYHLLAFSGGDVESAAALKVVDDAQSFVSMKNLSAFDVICFVQMIIDSYLFHLLLLACYYLCFVHYKNTIDNVNAIKNFVISFSCCPWNHFDSNKIKVEENDSDTKHQKIHLAINRH